MTERDESKVETVDERLARLARAYATERIAECLEQAQLLERHWPPMANEFLKEADRLKAWLRNEAPTDDV